MMLKRLTGHNTVKFAFVLFLAALLFAAGAEIIQHRKVSYPESIVQNAESRLIELELKLKTSLEKIRSFKTEDEFHKFTLHAGFEEKRIQFLCS